MKDYILQEMTKESIADLLIHPCPDDPSVTAIQIPSTRTVSPLPYAPFTLNLETLKICNETQNAIVGEFISLLGEENPPSAVFGFGRERCGDIIQGVAQGLGIFGGKLSIVRRGSGADYADMEEEVVNTPLDSAQSDISDCAFVTTTMVMDLNLVSKSIAFLRGRGFYPNLLVALIDIESQRNNNTLAQFGLGYKSLVSTADLMERPEFEEMFGAAIAKRAKGFEPRSDLTIKARRVLDHLGLRNPK